jgi:uncharacterized protein YqeY
MDFLDKIGKDLTAAMKGTEPDRELVISVLRMMKSAVKNAEIAKRGSGKDLTDEDVTAVLSSMVKQRRESTEQYEKAGRTDLAAKETNEIGIIQRYLPQQLTSGELDEVIRATMKEAGVSDLKDLGRLMKNLMPKVKGKADGKVVNERVRAILEGE